MTPRQHAANRKNARASTGPKTAAGKTQVRSNARRHGLAARNRFVGTLASEAHTLAHVIAGSNASSEVLTAARRIAEAQLDLVQVRAARYQLIAPALSGEGTFVWLDMARQLRALDRYERRALSRRRRASEDLDTIRIVEATTTNYFTQPQVVLWQNEPKFFK